MEHALVTVVAVVIDERTLLGRLANLLSEKRFFLALVETLAKVWVFPRCQYFRL
jgi:hypothetical protein